MNACIVGELNPYGADPHFALYHLPEGASGDRLRRIMGLRACEYEPIPKYNLCVGKWSIKAARERARELLLGEHDVFVLCGKKVAAGFVRATEKSINVAVPFTTLVITTPHYRAEKLVFLPHPSGLCRVWNEPGAVARARQALTSAGIPCAAPGEPVVWR